MDTFTATVDPNQPQSAGMVKKPNPHFRLIFLLLLIAVLLSAGATTYILISRTTAPVPVVETVEPNPFDETLSENPLEEDANQTASAGGIFVETATDNFFDQFGDNTATSSDSYENPF